MSRASVYKCAGCNGLAIAERKDVTTCSPACRVRAHRNGSADLLRRISKEWDVKPGGVVRGQALHALRPDLAAKVMAGSLSIEDAQPEMLASLAALIAGGAHA
jgi:hypothetical protein